MSDSVRPHRWQPTRLPHPWDSPGKNTGVGCHVLLQCMEEKSESEVAHSCLTLSDPMDCSPPGSPVHGFSRQECWSGLPLPSPSVWACQSKHVRHQHATQLSLLQFISPGSQAFCCPLSKTKRNTSHSFCT